MGAQAQVFLSEGFSPEAGLEEKFDFFPSLPLTTTPHHLAVDQQVSCMTNKFQEDCMTPPNLWSVCSSPVLFP